jgi:hypothetical protein
MKKIKLTVVLAIFIAGISNVKSEEFSMGELSPYLSEYMTPFAKAMSISMSGGWAHTAKVHKTLGFDVAFSISATNIPTSDHTFNTSGLNMPKYSFDNNTTPTISGANDAEVSKISRQFDTGIIPPLVFDGFKGLDIHYSGMMAIQGGIGLPKGTEIILRFIPNISSITNNLIPEGVNIELEPTGMWGIGVKHDIKQWIPVIKKVPFLQISGLFSYSKFYTGFSGDDLKITPTRLNATDNTTNSWDNQKLDIGISSFTGSLLVGANIPIFQPFIGIGFNSSKFKGGFIGDYPIIELNNTEYVVNKSEKDPLVIETNNTNFNFQAGARLKLGVFVFHYQYTIQNYAMHTAGIAVTFR